MWILALLKLNMIFTTRLNFIQRRLRFLTGLVQKIHIVSSRFQKYSRDGKGRNSIRDVTEVKS
jgi:hypothetical protein